MNVLISMWIEYFLGVLRLFLLWIVVWVFYNLKKLLKRCLYYWVQIQC